MTPFAWLRSIENLKARVPLPDGEGLGEGGSVYGTQTSDYRNARHLRERRNSLYEHLGCATPGVCMPSWKLTCLHNARMAAVRGGERASRAFEWVEGAARQGEETMGGARRPATDHSPQNSRGSRPGPAAGPPPRRCWETTRDVDPSRTRPRRKLKLCPKKRNCPRGRMQKRLQKRLPATPPTGPSNRQSKTAPNRPSKKLLGALR